MPKATKAPAAAPAKKGAKTAPKAAAPSKSATKTPKEAPYVLMGQTIAFITDDMVTIAAGVLSNGDTVSFSGGKQELERRLLLPFCDRGSVIGELAKPKKA